MRNEFVNVYTDRECTKFLLTATLETVALMFARPGKADDVINRIESELDAKLNTTSAGLPIVGIFFNGRRFEFVPNADCVFCVSAEQDLYLPKAGRR